MLAVSLVSVLVVIFNIWPGMVGSFFTTDEVVIAIVTDAMPMLTIYLAFDAIHGAQSGNVRALGRQKAAALFTLCAYYGCGMPLAIVFGFKLGMGVKGFWLGFMLSMISLDIFVAFLVIYADWTPKVLEKAEEEDLD